MSRQVRTLNDRGETPIMDVFAAVDEQPPVCVNSRVASYLADVDPTAYPDHTPFTEDTVSEASLESHSSRKTSTSTIKAPKTSMFVGPATLQAEVSQSERHVYQRQQQESLENDPFVTGKHEDSGLPKNSTLSCSYQNMDSSGTVIL